MKWNKIFLSFAVIIFFLSVEPSTAQDDGPPVKKSNSGICHVKGSRFYNQTKNFTPFNSIGDCVKSGGREVGNNKTTRIGTDLQYQSPDDPNVKKSKSGICDEKGSRFYNQTRNFTPFKSIDDCVKSGGRRVGEKPSLGASANPTLRSLGEPNVKKSRSGICHPKGSTSYSRTKNFIPFTSMGKCIQSGGRPSKRKNRALN